MISKETLARQQLYWAAKDGKAPMCKRCLLSQVDPASTPFCARCGDLLRSKGRSREQQLNIERRDRAKLVAVPTKEII